MPRVEGGEVSVPLAYGTCSFYMGKKATDSASHKWTVYLRGAGCEDEDLSHVVSKVVFGLHTSFKQPTRTVESPPYEVTETGWGEFDITITVHFQPDANEKPLELAHMLKLYEDGHQQGAPQSTKKPVVSEKYDEVVFLEPEETFHSRLNNHVAMPLATPSTIAPFLPKYDDRAEIAKIQEARRKTAEQKAELEAQVEAVEAEVRGLRGGKY